MGCSGARKNAGEFQAFASALQTATQHLRPAVTGRRRIPYEPHIRAGDDIPNPVTLSFHYRAALCRAQSRDARLDGMYIPIEEELTAAMCDLLLQPVLNERAFLHCLPE